MISLLDFQPQSIAKLMGNRGFRDRYIIMSKSDSSLSGPLHKLRIVDMLRSVGSQVSKHVHFFIAIKFCAKYSHINWKCF